MTRSSTFLYRLAYVFALLGVIFIPFPFYLFNVPSFLADHIFGDLIVFIGRSAFGIRLPKQAPISSDSTSLYILLLLLLFLSVIIVLLLSFIKHWKSHQPAALSFLRTLFFYYLALLLLKYGADKIFKTQFYLPEPNILYTPFGQLSKDILYWSVMGTSRPYNIFLGLLEIIPAVLLVFKRTRVVGLLTALPVLFNIVAVNLSFDISVKVFSFFLLFLSLLLLLQYVNGLYRFFVKKETAVLPAEPVWFSFSKHPFAKGFIKTALIVFFLVETLYPVIKTRNYNDDLLARPYLHGAYEVVAPSVPRNNPNSFPAVRRFFIHRSGYIIFQDTDDNMQDYQLHIDSIQQQFILTNYRLEQKRVPYRYSEQDSLLELHSPEFHLTGRRINWKETPALKNEFHWFSDRVH